MTQPAQLGILQNTKFIEPTTYERHTIRYIYTHTQIRMFSHVWWMTYRLQWW